MSDIFQKALKRVLEHEGLYSDDQDDRGGKTKFGITEEVARENGYTAEMKYLPLSMAEYIYKKDYWDAANLDKVSNYSFELALEVFDSGVNCGIDRSAKWLQQGINILTNRPSLVVDGIVGRQTIISLEELKHRLDRVTLIKIMNVYQGDHYIALCVRDDTQTRFVRGWFKRVSFEEEM